MFRKIRTPAHTLFKPKRLCVAAAILAAAAFSSCVPWTDPASLKITPISSATQISLPDLVVSAVQTEMPEGRACEDPAGGFIFHIVIRNQGENLASPFEVSANGKLLQSNRSLVPGAEIEMTLEGYAETLIIEIDPSALLAESNETNNIYQENIPSPLPSPGCFPTPTTAPNPQAAVFTMEGHTGKVLSVAFSPDGNLLASGSVDNTLRLWRVDQGTLLRTMTGHPFPVGQVVFSPNGANLATGSPDGIIRIWSVSNGLLVKTLLGHGGGITDLLFTPDNRHLLSSAEDFTVRIWNISDGRLLRIIDEGMTVVTGLASDLNGKNAVWIEEDGSLKMIRLADGAWLNRWHGIQQPAASLAISPDGSFLVTGYQDGRIQLWSLPQGALLETLVGHNATVTSLAIDPQGKWLASGSTDASLRLWRLSPTLIGETAPSPGQYLALSQVYLGHTGHINQVVFSPEGKLLASGGDDGTVRLWSVPEN